MTIATQIGLVRSEFIAAEIRRHRFHWTSEEELQAGLAQVLAEARIPAQREASLGAAGRVDLLAEGRIGIEVKVDGTATTVLRQVARYAERGRLAGLVVVCGRARLGSLLPPSYAGVPIIVVNLWAAAL